MQIDVTTAADQEIPYQEQDYHDARISTFKSIFTGLLYKYGGYPQGNIECLYLSNTGKFKILAYDKSNENRVQFALQHGQSFRREYLDS